ncbi:MATE family efflux transporter [Pacificimonas flava]|uniref:MATE family efflux transporter n=3 Tax=Sphingosinicellaceae TaxID=2820280 RepID=A0A219B9Y8_9SPHN|nr:MATE family efflux transporter [Pacificimonas aurantium]OWV34598.1 MATE family efflux transporter [Pacificimonas flava]
MIFGVAAISSVGIIDAYFVGQIGPQPLAAISFAFPVTIALTSLGVGVLVGINSVVSRGLGSGRRDLAERRAGQGVALAALVGLALTAVLMLLQGPLFSLLGAKGETAALIDRYMFPYLAGYPFLLLSMGSNGVLRAQGAAKRSSGVLITMAAANWVLDPLLITGWGPFPAFGISGAAYASAGSFVIAGLTASTFAARSQLGLHLAHLKDGDLLAGMRELAAVGAPAAVSNAINPVGLTVLTGFLSSYGDDAVAAFGVAGRIQTFAVVPLLAMSSSIGAIVGQNWGAGRPDRARKALWEAGGFCLAYGTAIAALLVAFRGEAARLFSDDPAIIDAIGLYLQIAAWGFGGYGILIVTNGALNGIGRADRSFLLSVIRVLAVMVPVAWLGGHVAAEAGVYGGELTANLAGAVLAYLFARRYLREDSCPAAQKTAA